MMWDEKSIREIRDLQQKGLSASKIAAKLGVSRNAIIGVFYRHRDIFPASETRRPASKPRGGDPFWTEIRLSEAAALWNTGQSKFVIAAALGCSEKAVEGAVRRHPGRFEARQKRVRAAANNVASSRQPVVDEMFEHDGLPDRETVKGYDLTRYQLKDVAPVAFVDLTTHQCHFPLQAFSAVCGPETPCCGAPALEGAAWCGQHWRLVHRKAVAA